MLHATEWKKSMGCEGHDSLRGFILPRNSEDFLHALIHLEHEGIAAF
jgi:hypothetical protein